jgi:ribosomal protein L37E
MTHPKVHRHCRRCGREFLASPSEIYCSPDCGHADREASPPKAWLQAAGVSPVPSRSVRLQAAVEKLEAAAARSEAATGSLEAAVGEVLGALQEAKALLASQRPAAHVTDASGTVEFVLSRPLTLEGLESAYIRHILRTCRENRTHAAEQLGIDPSTLYRKLAKTGAES